MKRMNKKHISLQLSLYLDGQLGDADRREIEQLIATDPTVRTEYEELRMLRSLLAARDPLPESPFLPEKIMNRIRREAEEEEESLPVPQRLFPVIAGMVVILLAAVAAFAWLQRDQIFNYVENTGTQVQRAYEESILRGWIMPLFERTDRDEVLQFAMFGTLPLNDEAGTVLRVDEHADSGYRVELARAETGPKSGATIHDLYREIRPSAAQRRVFDTLFSYAQKQIESSVLMNKDKELAIDPAISKYHKVILSGIAASLEPEQLVRFEEFLSSRNTPYTFVSYSPGSVPPTQPPVSRKVVDHFRTVRMPEEFVVFTRDSIAYARLHLDMDSLRRLMKVLENQMPRFDVRVDDLARTVSLRGARELSSVPHEQVMVRSSGDGNGRHTVTITIQAEAEVMREMESGMRELMQEVTILRREKAESLRNVLRVQRPTRPERRQRVEVHIHRDAKMEVTVDVDSIYEDVFDNLDDMNIDLPADEFQLFDDSLSFQWQQYIPKMQRQQLDSLLRKRVQPGEDTRQKLRREMEEHIELDLRRKKLAPPEMTAPPSKHGMQVIPAPELPAAPRHPPPMNIPSQPSPAKKDTVYDI